MKRYVFTVFSILLSFSLVACSSLSQEEVVQENEVEEVIEESDSLSESSKILIAYFTWADNTVVEDPSAIDVDATTSASVLAPGNAAKLANWIQEEVGGDLFSIKVEDLYSSNYDECLDRASEEKASNELCFDGFAFRFALGHTSSSCT